MARGYWLFKSEPDCYAYDDLVRDGLSPWEGVRNYMARNHMRTMRVGDRGFFYHSSCEAPGIAGICEVIREAYADGTQFDAKSEHFDAKATPENPRWFMVDVKPVLRFADYVPLSILRETAGLEEMIVARRGNRLSIMPVTAAEWKIVTRLGSG
jgi:predicted RNA-binding protein with PUA-like domain